MTEFEHDWICSVCSFDITCVSTFPTLFIYSLANIGVRIVWRIFNINYFYLRFDSIWLLSVWLSSCLRRVGLFYKTLQSKYPLKIESYCRLVSMEFYLTFVKFHDISDKTTVPCQYRTHIIRFNLFGCNEKMIIIVVATIKLEISYSIYVTDLSSYQSYCFS